MMYCAVIDRKGILDAIQDHNLIEARGCSSSEIEKLLSILQKKEILLLWENKKIHSKPVWIIHEDSYSETLAYIDTYTKKCTPFTAFYRAIKRSYFCDYLKLQPKKVEVDVAPFIGVIMAEAITIFGATNDNPDNIPIQAYLSTLSATLVSALDKGYLNANQLSEIAKIWERTNLLLGVERDNRKNDLILDFWCYISRIIENPRAKYDSRHLDKMPKVVYEFLQGVSYNRRISKKDWEVLVADSSIDANFFEKFTIAREDGIKNFRTLIKEIEHRPGSRKVESEVIIAAALALISSGTMDLLGYVLSFTGTFPMVAHWYAFLVGVTSGASGFRTQKGVANHIEKFVSKEVSIFSSVTSDISYAELSVVLTQKIDMLPFVTEYSSIINIELYPLVESKFRINRNSPIAQGGDRDYRSLSAKEHEELAFLINQAQKILGAGGISRRIEKSVVDVMHKKGKDLFSD